MFEASSLIARSKLRHLAVRILGVPVLQIGGTSFGSLADATHETKIGAVQIGPHAAQNLKGSRQMPIHIPSDTIHFNTISANGGNAGNGGAGVNTGNIIDNAHINFNPTNTANGSDVDVHTGNHTDQSAAGFLAGNHNVSGPEASAVHADTTAYQTNFLAADMSQSVLAGIGGNGGNGNSADGGDVHVHT